MHAFRFRLCRRSFECVCFAKLNTTVSVNQLMTYLMEAIHPVYLMKATSICTYT